MKALQLLAILILAACAGAENSQLADDTATPPAQTTNQFTDLLQLADRVKDTCRWVDNECTYWASYHLPLAPVDLAAMTEPVPEEELEDLITASLTGFAYGDIEGEDLEEFVRNVKYAIKDGSIHYDIVGGNAQDGFEYQRVEETYTVVRVKPEFYQVARTTFTLMPSCGVGGPDETLFVISNRTTGILSIASDVCD